MRMFKNRSSKFPVVMHKTSTRDKDFWQMAHMAIVDQLIDEANGIHKTDSLKERVEFMLRDFMEIRNFEFANDAEFKRSVQLLLDEITGFGPIQSLLEDNSISDILINKSDTIFVEKQGVLYRENCTFLDDAHVLRVIRRMIATIGKRIDESSPMVDARLPDGSRINAIIPPLAIDGPVLSIRKFNHRMLSGEDLITIGTVNAETLAMLKRMVTEKKNILISGGTGTGKTTLLNILSQYIDSSERVITIEDSAELQLQTEHVIRLETRPPNTDGVGEILSEHLVKNALRMRPNRIILGESRGAEVLDVLQAMNTGHSGSMSTVHANSAGDAITRLKTMIRMSDFKGNDLFMSELIASAIDVIVHLNRKHTGERFVGEIIEITSVQEDQVRFKTLYTYGSLLRMLSKTKGGE